MKYLIEEREKVLIIYFQEKLDINSSLEIEEDLTEKLEKDIKYVVFDFKNTQYISSSGIRVIVSTHKKLEKRNGALYVTNLSESVKVVLKLVELDKILNIVESTEIALLEIDGRK
ncbi:MAG: STAS domain-containing protein [Spirochaetales bacterium]|nr:STAS domain-containing protein [Exilispira sp.]NMC67811.1 STAS domain-containing protein [Spirochaetales bacterium]